MQICSDADVSAVYDMNETPPVENVRKMLEVQVTKADILASPNSRPKLNTKQFMAIATEHSELLGKQLQRLKAEDSVSLDNIAELVDIVQQTLVKNKTKTIWMSMLLSVFGFHRVHNVEFQDITTGFIEIQKSLPLFAKYTDRAEQIKAFAEGALSTQTMEKRPYGSTIRYLAWYAVSLKKFFAWKSSIKNVVVGDRTFWRELAQAMLVDLEPSYPVGNSNENADIDQCLSLRRRIHAFAQDMANTSRTRKVPIDSSAKQGSFKTDTCQIC